MGKILPVDTDLAGVTGTSTSLQLVLRAHLRMLVTFRHKA